MSTPLVTDEKSRVEEWDYCIEKFKRAIEDGLLDDQLKTLATMCVERNKRLKTSGNDPKQSPLVRADVDPPCVVRVAQQAPSVKDAAIQEARDAVAQSQGASSHTTRQSKRGRRRFSSSETFRHIDGKLYRKCDVKYQLFPWPTNPKFWCKIMGIGDRAAKIVFVNQDGSLITNVNHVPLKFVENDKIQDPIYFDLREVDHVVQRCTPVKES